MSRSDVDDHEQGRRIFVIAPDEPGAAEMVAGVLREADIGIESIDGRMIDDLGVIVLRAGDDDAALHALLEADLSAVTSEAIVFHMPDRPGALAGVARLLADHRLNVRTIHIVHRMRGRAVVAVATDDDSAARSLLERDSLL